MSEARTHRACIVGHITVKDYSCWAAYCERVPETLVPWRAELVLRGAHRIALSGDSNDTDVVVIRFPDIGSIERWYRSPAYQAIIPLREQAADVVLTAYSI
jgi:uncharacterized protein (DUF1330 family)